VQNLAITPFSATVNCGSLLNTWTYTGVDLADGQVLDIATKLMSISSSSGAITVALIKPPGTYNIKIIGALPDLTTTTFDTFTITITAPSNSPPYFATALTDLSVALMGTATYIFPTMKDPDVGDAVSLSSVKN
jgi:hypothetical protein